MSKRSRKKEARKSGLTLPELELVELLEEVIERFSLLEVLTFANNFLISERSQISPAERERIFQAALRAVEPESSVQAWRERLGRIKGEVLARKRDIRRERKKERLGKATPRPEEHEKEAGA